MPISTLQCAGNLSIALQKAVTGFANVNQGPNLINFDLTAINLATYTQAYLAQLSTTTTLDLTSFTNLVGESVTLSMALAMVVTCTGGSCVITPGASNGLSGWFFPSGGVTLNDGDSMIFLRNPSKTPVPVTSTSKTITFTITGATVNVAIIGG